MTERQEVAVFGEHVDDSENHRYATHLRQTFDEVHDHVRPGGHGHLYRLHQTHGMEVLCLVVLAGNAGTNKVSDSSVCPGNEEIGVKSMKRLLSAFMIMATGTCQDHQQHRLGRWHIHLVVDGDEVV
jgi:hypothetical protein